MIVVVVVVVVDFTLTRSTSHLRNDRYWSCDEKREEPIKGKSDQPVNGGMMGMRMKERRKNKRGKK